MTIQTTTKRKCPTAQEGPPADAARCLGPSVHRAGTMGWSVGDGGTPKHKTAQRGECTIIGTDIKHDREVPEREDSPWSPAYTHMLHSNNATRFRSPPKAGVLGALAGGELRRLN